MRAWYFSENPPRLRYGDGREIKAGITHKVECDPVLCEAGLHGSVRPLDALGYAPGPYAWRVELGGVIVRGDDKAVATERAYLWGYDATDTLRKFARLCALDVTHIWDAPGVVVRYLKTGDESLRDAALAAARDAVRDAAWGAARDAAWDATLAAALAAARAAARAAAGAAVGSAARDAALAAALAAARDAVRDAAWDAALAAARAAARAAAGAAARAAVRDAARDAAWEKQNARLYRMLMGGRK